MTEWEERVNRVLGMLNDERARRRMPPGEYCARRRALLADAAALGRAAASAVPRSAHDARGARTRASVMAGWWKLPLWFACMMLGALLVYWHYAAH